MIKKAAAFTKKFFNAIKMSKKIPSLKE